jgi:hypothetical protein
MFMPYFLASSLSFFGILTVIVTLTIQYNIVVCIKFALSLTVDSGKIFRFGIIGILGVPL